MNKNEALVKRTENILHVQTAHMVSGPPPLQNPLKRNAKQDDGEALKLSQPP